MEGRRFRRHVRTTAAGQTLLPLRSTRLSNTLSCWYCDLKITRFNQPLYRFGQRHARFFRVWFTVGIGFSLSLLLGVTMVLVWDLWRSWGSNKITDMFNSLLFGVNPWGLRFKMSLADVGYLVGSTVISVVVHEFGHSVAAASEGIQLEYIAIFLAVLFPGALVAFNHELLQVKQQSAALRIYCAGIWHNAVCCAVCGLTLLLLPFILSPLFIHTESPMVLGVSASSPLSSYLSAGDVIVSLEGVKIHSALDWVDVAMLLEKRTSLYSDSEVMKGYLPTVKRTYCAPKSLVEKSTRLFSVSNQSACISEQIAFASVACSDSRAQSATNGVIQKIDNSGYCLSSADALSLKSCESFGMTEAGCICSESELCLSPVQIPGVVWAEITYRSPHNHQCNLTAVDASDYEENCLKTFLYVGDAISMAESLRLTSYKPRFPFPFGAYLPDVFEKIFVWTFQISVALALLNSLPVYSLDGESILEVCSLYLTAISPGKRRLLLQGCLFGTSVAAFLVLLKTLLITLWHI